MERAAMKYPTRFQQKTLWSAATGLAMLTLGVLLVGLIWLIGQIFGFLQPVLVPLIVAGIIAYLLDPLVRILEKRGLSRLWAVIAVFLATLGAIALLVAAVIPAVQGGREVVRNVFRNDKPKLAKTLPTNDQKPQAKEDGSDATPAETSAEDEKSANKETPDAESTNLAKSLAENIHQMRKDHPSDPIGWALTETTDMGEPIAYPNGVALPATLDFFWRTRAGRMIFEYQDEIMDTGRRWLRIGSTKVFGFLGLVLGMIMVPIYLFFFLKDSVSIRTHWHEYVPLKASRFKTELVSTLQEINGYLISFFRGQVLVGMIDGVLVGIALFIFDLPYAILVGIFMAILGVVPYIGNIICLIPACFIGYLHAQTAHPYGLDPWPYTLGVIAIFVGVQQINSLVTAPKIVGDSVGLHPLTVIFSMLFWSLVLGGFVGALLAVPLSAAVKVIFRRYFWERTMREETPSGFVV